MEIAGLPFKYAAEFSADGTALEVRTGGQVYSIPVKLAPLFCLVDASAEERAALRESGIEMHDIDHYVAHFYKVGDNVHRWLRERN